MAEDKSYHHQRWLKHFEAIDFEIGQLAKVCQVQLLDPGNIERVLRNDMLVCGHQNERAFAKMRDPANGEVVAKLLRDKHAPSKAVRKSAGR